jgi:hypothetical protein
MRDSFDLSETGLGATERTALVEYCHALRDGPNINIQAITLYGSAVREDYRPGRSDINLLVILEHIDVPILNGVLDTVSGGQRYGFAPFFLTEGDLRSSADVFPVKFLMMQDSYRVLWGRDVLGELEISRENLRLRCEQKAKNLLLRLRRHYLMGGGRRRTEMLTRVIGGFIEDLRVIISLSRGGLPSRAHTLEAAAKAFDLDGEVLSSVESLRNLDASLTTEDADRLYDGFMAIVERVAGYLDRMDGGQ